MFSNEEKNMERKQKLLHNRYLRYMDGVLSIGDRGPDSIGSQPYYNQF